MRGGMRIYYYEGEPFDLDKLEDEAVALRKENLDEDTERHIEWADSNYARRIQGTRRIAAGEKAILRIGQEDISIARLQHNRVSDKQE